MHAVHVANSVSGDVYIAYHVNRESKLIYVCANIAQCDPKTQNICWGENIRHLEGKEAWMAILPSSY